ncbi:MAG: hypothetical protein HY075_09050 [Deltaproteobacteria bacterium]|nr:hypothetical protein [Deltaproteobacteria bacterium]
MRFAYANLGRSLDMCLASPSCQLTAEETRLVTSVRKSGGGQLVFLSEKENPGTFLIDGAVRVAKTEYAVGATIYLNKDLLYSANAKGELKAIDTAAASGALLHELGHQQGERSHDKLDLLAAKLRSLLLLDTQRLTYIFADNIALTALNQLESGLATRSTQLLVEDGENLTDLTSLVASRVPCAEIFGPGTEVESFLLWNLHWGHSESRFYGGVIRMAVEGNLEMQCKTPAGGRPISSGWAIRGHLNLVKSHDAAPYRIDSPSSTRFYITPAE